MRRDRLLVGRLIAFGEFGSLRNRPTTAKPPCTTNKHANTRKTLANHVGNQRRTDPSKKNICECASAIDDASRTTRAKRRAHKWRCGGDVRAKRNIVRRDKELLVVFNGSSVALILLVFVLLVKN